MDHDCKKTNPTQPSGFKIQNDGNVRCAACGLSPSSGTNNVEKITYSDNTSHNKRDRKSR